MVSTNIKQLKQKFAVRNYRAVGCGMDMPIFAEHFYDEARRNGAVQDSMNDIECDVKLTPSTWFEFDIQPKTELALFFFEKKQ